MKQVNRFAVALLLVSAAAIAQQVTPPPPAPPRQANLPQPVEKTLANGLRVIAVPKHDVPLASARLMIKTGSEADPADLAGLAQLTASLLNRGTATRSAEEIARGVEALGATLETNAGWDNSTVDMGVMSTNFGKALEFVGDVVRNPAFKADEVDRARAQSLDSLQVALRDPGALAAFVASRVVFGDSPYGHNTGGTLESLERIKGEPIAQFHKDYYRPDNAVLVVAGDLKPETVFATAEKVFGSWKRGANPVAAKTSDRTPPAPRVLVIDMPDAGQAAVVVARPGLKSIDPFYYQAVVANSVLGGGYSARLNQEVRIKRGLSYGANSSFDLRRDVGPFTATTQTKNESAAEVAGIIVDEMKKLATGDLVEAELTPRKAVLIGNFGRSLETGAGIVGRLAYLALYGLSLDEINRYISSVQGVSASAVREFARKNLVATPSSIVVVGNAKQFIEPLKQRFGDVDVIPIDQLDLNAPTLRKM